MRNRNLLFLLAFLMSIMSVQTARADEASLKAGTTSGWVPTSFGLSQTYFEFDLYLGEYSGAYSCWLDDPELGYTHNGTYYKIGNLSNLGIKGMLACGNADKWNDHMNEIRTIDGYMGYSVIVKPTNPVYASESYNIFAYDPRRNGSKEYWVTLKFMAGSIVAGQNLKFSVKGHWRNNANYDVSNASNAVELSVSTNSFSTSFPSWGTLKRTSPTVLNYSGSTVAQSGWAWGLELYGTDACNTTPSFKSETAAGASSINTNFSVDFYTAYTLYPNLCLKKTVTVDNHGQPTRINKKYSAVKIPGYPRVVDGSVTLTGDQWRKTVTLNWKSEIYDASNVDTNGKWTIWRKVSGTNDNTSVKVGEVDYTTSSFTDDPSKNGTDELVYGTQYTYCVVFQPKAFSAYTQHSDFTKHYYRYNRITLKPTFNFAFTADSVVGDSSFITVKWGYNPTFQDASPTKKYYVKLNRKIDNGKFTTVKTYEVTNSKNNTEVYTETNVTNSCTTYGYQLEVDAMDSTFTSSIQYASISGTSRVTNVEVSKGNYNNAVKLNWEAVQIGTSPTYYTVYRRPLGSISEADWAQVYTVSGTSTRYSWDDQNALPGNYYDYKVVSQTDCGGKLGAGTSRTGNGFAMATGVVSGRVTYGNGMAVSDVKVTLNTDSDVKDPFHALKVNGKGNGVVYDCGRDEILKLMDGKDFTIQMYVRPELDSMNVDKTRYIALDVRNTYSLWLTYDASRNAYQVCQYMNSKHVPTGIYIPGNQYTHLTFAYNSQTQQNTVYAYLGDSLVSYALNAPVPVHADASSLVLGADANFDYGNFLHGYIDEFRFWSRTLSKEEVAKNYNCILSGEEQGLAIYWPMDEGIDGQPFIYDYSKTNDVANGRHGTVRTGTSMSTITPTADQLSLCAYTDTLGKYVLRGIPISGSGVNYTVTPTLGIHEFSPMRATAYVSNNSLVHSAVDFSDVSSFPVRGTIYYEGTDYPVAGCHFYIDGTICSKDGKLIETDANGEYEISVPIGDHFIEVRQTGHTFVGGGRYPQDPHGVGVYKTFDQSLSNLTFYDNTLVNLSGRVVGGDIEGGKNLGFGLSENNIGQVRLTMKPQNDKYRMNVVTTQGQGLSTTMQNNTQTVECPSSTSNIQSSSYRGAGDNVKYIYIDTDPQTGEFSAMVPPLQYSIESIKVKKTGKSVGDARVVDMSNALFEQRDSISSDSVYRYNSSLMVTYHSDPVFTVTDRYNEDGAYGLSEYEYEDENGKVLLDGLYTWDEANQKFDYTYGAPLFIMGDKYMWDIDAYEQYTNADNGVVSRVPLAGTEVTIANALSSEQGVAYIDMNGVQAGSVVDLQEGSLELNDEGHATYIWRAGLPNICSPFTRNVSMSYQLNGKSCNWVEGGQPGIILGELTTGANFVTSGPDAVHMILRDPPGTGSHTEWTTGEVTTTHSLTGSQWTSETEINTKTNFGVSVTTAEGVGVAFVTNLDADNILEVGAKVVTEGESSHDFQVTVSAERTVSTSSEPEYVGAQGDLFIGSATNITFGKARMVGFQRVNGNGDELELRLEDVVSSGVSFSTDFSYTQNYIENVLVPNFQAMKNTYLTTVTQSVLNAYKNGTKKNTSDHMLYLTTLSPDDEKWGTNNTDKDVWGSQAKSASSNEGPSYWAFRPVNTALNDSCYTDSVYWLNSQISTWEHWLAVNERDKVEAFDDRGNRLIRNVSFDSGSTQSYTTSIDTTDVWDTDWTIGAVAILGENFGGKINKTGIEWEIKTESGGSEHFADGHSTEKMASFTYEFAEEGDDDALTVDVLSSEWSPIFRTRGGQTCNPFEGVEYARYYEPEKMHKISDGTMQIEKPMIDVDQAIVSDVPSGSAANFTLRLTNASEIDEDVYYKLLMIDESNPNGASIVIDGMVLTEGRSVKVPAGETITKAMQLKQTNLSVLDYENIGIVLASPTQYDPTSTWDVIADTVFVSAHFVPSSSEVNLMASSSVVNMHTGNDLDLTFSGFDRNYYNLKAFRLQYKYEGDANWTQIQEYVLKSKDKTASNLLLPTSGGNITYTLPMEQWNDGQYTFRMVSVSTYGTGEVYRYSDEVSVYKDTARPALLGSANPTTGILSAGDDISVRFNEDIRSGALTKTNNFSIIGALNDAAVDHEVGLNLTGADQQAQTDVDINLSDHDFSIGMWVRRSSDGVLLSHGASGNPLRVIINNEGKLQLTISGKTYTSSASIPANKWCYLVMSMQSNPQAEGYLLDASVASDASNTQLFLGQAVSTNYTVGRLTVGGGITGAVNELTLWNKAMSSDELIAKRLQSKSPSTQNLIGYWKMNEGHGTELTDVARSRNMQMTAENWYLNNVNKAAHFDGKSRMAVSTSSTSTTDDESYAVELWVRPDALAQSTLLQSGDERLTIGMNANGQVEVTSGDQTYRSTRTLQAGTWHHLALNVLRGSSAILYLDGNNVLSMSEQSLPALQGDSLIIGASRTRIVQTGKPDTFKYASNFQGDVDELRVWNATLQGKYLTDGRYNRVDTAQVRGLALYCPMEHSKLDGNQQVVTEFSLDNILATGTVAQTTALPKESATAPALKTAPDLTNLQYNFTASEREIYINLTDEAARLEGTTVYLTLSNVRDLHDNNCVPVVWSAYVRQNALRWESDNEQITLDEGMKGQFTATITNQGGTAQEWSLTGLPSWMTANISQGTLEPLKSQTIQFNISNALAIGKYAETLYLVGNSAIYEPMEVGVKVIGEVPDWSVDAQRYDLTMNLTAQLQIAGAVCEDEDSRVAAFVGDECIGLAQPQYINTRDAYYLCMTIYGDDTTTDKPVSFKVWDSTTGIVYTGIQSSQDIVFNDGGIYGTFSKPVILTTTDVIEQKLPVARGWNWTSYYVQPEETAVNTVLGGYADEIGLIKDRTSFVLSDGSKYEGSLTDIQGATLYMLNANDVLDVLVSGRPVTAEQGAQKVNANWNWLGNPCQSSITVDQAFAGLNPAEDDLVKSRNAFAIYNGYTWEGNLTSIEPGKGYLYHSEASQSKTFQYPESATRTASRRSVRRADNAVQWFGIADISEYPSNMTMVAQLYFDGELVTDAELAAFTAGQCITATKSVGDKFFITIPGDGKGANITFKAHYGEAYYNAGPDVTYSDDAMLGTLQEPVRMDIDSTTGVISITADSEDVHTISGIRVTSDNQKNLRPGIYIRGNKTVIVK